MAFQEKVSDVQKQMEKMTAPGADQTQALDLLKTLRHLPMDLDILARTRIGRTVNQLRKGSGNKEVTSLAKSLIEERKMYLPENEGKSSPTNATATPKSGEVRKSNGDSDGESSAAKKPKLEKEPPKPASQPFPSSKAIASFPPVSTTDAVRLKCRELLTNAIRGDGVLPDGTNDPEFLAEQLEDAIYREFNNTETKYKNRVRGRVSNLKDPRNPSLRLNFLVGESRPERLAKMTAEEMASEDKRSFNKRLGQTDVLYGLCTMRPRGKTDLLKCENCGKWDCSYSQMVGANQPTHFALCKTCGHRWKFN